MDIQKALLGAMGMGVMFTTSMNDEKYLDENIEQVFEALLSKKIGLKEFAILMMIGEDQGTKLNNLANARRTMIVLRNTIRRAGGDSTEVANN